MFRSVLALDDTSHSIALGAAIGMFIGLTPTVGIQTVIVMLLAFLTSRLFYFNRAAALLTIYVSNPLTVVPLYYGIYWVGTLFVAGDASVEQFDKLLSYEGMEGWWETVCGLAIQYGKPLAIGTAIIAPTFSLLSYPTVRLMIRWFRKTDQPEDKQSEASPDTTDQAQSVQTSQRNVARSLHNQSTSMAVTIR